MRSTLKALELVLRKYKDTVAFVAKPRSPIQVACDFITGIFKWHDVSANVKPDATSPKPSSGYGYQYRDGLIETVDQESIQWQLIPHYVRGLAVRGSSGTSKDYWFTVHNHQMSLVFQNKEEQSPPVTIFKVANDEPESVGVKMIDSFKDHHMEDKVLKLLGPLRDIVEGQVRVH
jgi:hypothetical protein